MVFLFMITLDNIFKQVGSGGDNTYFQVRPFHQGFFFHLQLLKALNCLLAPCRSCTYSYIHYTLGEPWRARLLPEMPSETNPLKRSHDATWFHLTAENKLLVIFNDAPAFCGTLSL